MKYVLELNEEQAQIVSKACEFFARIRMGQFEELVWHCAEKHCVDDRDETQRLWLELRKHIYPDLHGAGHSYGMGKFRDADLAFDVYQVIRQHFNDTREPFSYHELPVFQVKYDPVVLTANEEDIEDFEELMRNCGNHASVTYNLGSGCRYCENATTNPELSPDEDWKCIIIGDCEDKTRILYRTGDNRSTALLVERWNEHSGWGLIGDYRPKFCPECGRKLVENGDN